MRMVALFRGVNVGCQAACFILLACAVSAFGASIEDLTETMRSGSWVDKDMAAAELSKMRGDPRAFTLLAQAAAKGDADLRANAALALGRQGDLRALPLLEHLALTDRDERVRISASGMALGSMGLAAVDAEVRILLRSGNPRVKDEALGGLSSSLNNSGNDHLASAQRSRIVDGVSAYIDDFRCARDEEYLAVDILMTQSDPRVPGLMLRLLRRVRRGDREDRTLYSELLRAVYFRRRVEDVPVIHALREKCVDGPADCKAKLDHLLVEVKKRSLHRPEDAQGVALPSLSDDRQVVAPPH